MARRKSIINGKRCKTYSRWSDLDHDLLLLVMIQLGVADYYSFRRVCKSWRLLACESENTFMAFMPPMSITGIFHREHKKICHLNDFEGRKLKTILASFAGGACVGFTSGYLIFFHERTRDFWLVNPVTRNVLHFPRFPIYYYYHSETRAVLVFSPSISAWVFVVLCKYSNSIWFSIEGKGAWDHVSQSFSITDLYAFKGTIYTLSHHRFYPIHERFRLCKLALSPQPKFTKLQIKNPNLISPNEFVSSSENLYAIDTISRSLSGLHELDLGEMKWVVPSEKTQGEYAFFCTHLNHFVAVKQKSWVDPRSQSHLRYADLDEDGENRLFTATMWYFPHQSMTVDYIKD